MFRINDIRSIAFADPSDQEMLNDTPVVWVGEFGRSPKISSMLSTPGRAHWPYAFTILMASASIRSGNIHGATDRNGVEVTDKLVSRDSLQRRS